MKLQMTLMAVLALGACDQGEDPASGGSAELEAFRIEALGLTIDMPAGTTASMLGDSVMLKAPSAVITVGVAGKFAGATLEEEIQELNMYSPKNLAKAEVEGGWDLSFENSGSAGTNYWVKSRRTIEGTVYTCETTAHTPDQQAAVVAACKTLRKD